MHKIKDIISKYGFEEIYKYLKINKIIEYDWVAGIYKIENFKFASIYTKPGQYHIYLGKNVIRVSEDFLIDRLLSFDEIKRSIIKFGLTNL